jgi:hypothetical protein
MPPRRQKGLSRWQQKAIKAREQAQEVVALICALERTIGQIQAMAEYGESKLQKKAAEQYGPRLAAEYQAIIQTGIKYGYDLYAEKPRFCLEMNALMEGVNAVIAGDRGKNLRSLFETHSAAQSWKHCALQA